VDVVARARRLAGEAYASTQELDHPNEVAELVASAGNPPQVVAAALLHDGIEDTDLDADTIAREVDPHVAELVSVLTEDESISDYLERKAEHRARVAEAGREAALIFVADKLSNARRMRHGGKRPDAKKLGHYGATLVLMRRAYPDLPLLDDLERELEAVRSDLQRSPA
jgi:(p)ppGpp synthase/HD superfamily hydrolase